MGLIREIFYTKDNTQDISLWTKVTEPNKSKSKILSGIPGGTYYVKTQLTDGKWISPYSPEVTQIVQALKLVTPTLNAPTVVSDTQIDLSWTDIENESNYELQSSIDNAKWTTEATLAANTVSYPDTGLTASTTYYYRLRGIGDGTKFLTSDYSATVSATTQAATPSIIVMSDSFNDESGDGLAIDSSKWNVLNPDPTIVSFSETAGRLRAESSSGTTTAISNRVESILSINTGSIAGILYSGITAEPARGINLGIDVNNRAVIQRDNTGNGSVDMYVVIGGTTAFSKTDLTTPLLDSTRWKITYDSSTTTTTFWYYNAGWISLGSHVAALPTGMKAQFFIEGGSPNVLEMDDFYMTSEDYSTEAPV